MTVSGDVLWHRPHVHHDGNRRSNCDQDNRHREYLRHMVPPSRRVWSGLLSNRRSVTCGDSGDSGAATSRRFSFYFALKVKLAAAAAPAATVTFCVWVPAASCHAVTV